MKRNLTIPRLSLLLVVRNLETGKEEIRVKINLPLAAAAMGLLALVIESLH